VYSKRKNSKYLDARYGPAKALNEYIQALADLGGGFEKLDATQHGYLSNIRMTLITLMEISEHIAERDSIFEGNRLIPVVEKGQSTYQRDLQRFLGEYRATFNSKAKGHASYREVMASIKEKDSG
jgi:hypothetical protein